MNILAELLPLFILRWLANRRCEHLSSVEPGVEYTQPRPGVYIEHRKRTEERKESREP